MTTRDDRTRAFNAARREELRRLPRLQANALAEIERQLTDTSKAIAEQLRDLGDGWRRSQLEALQREIDAALDAWRQRSTRTAHAAAEAAWNAGVDLVRVPLAAGGAAFVPHLNVRALVELRGALTHLITDVSLAAKNRINAQLAQVMIGMQPASDALTRIESILGGATRQRARTILYTEVGRAYSIASQDSLDAATAQLPGLKKRWLKSGKRHPRPDHVSAHGQVRAANTPFVVGGVKLMFPRDPKAPASHVINCGCLSIPVTDGSTWGKATVRFDPLDPKSRVRLERDD